MERTIQARNPRVVHGRLAGGQALLLHLESGAYHELNPVGAAIWDLLDRQRTLEEITAELRRALEDPPGDLESWVEGFLGELRDRDLLL